MLRGSIINLSPLFSSKKIVFKPAASGLFFRFGGAACLFRKHLTSQAPAA